MTPKNHKPDYPFTPAPAAPIGDFSGFALSERLQKSLQEANFKVPTPVQEAAIPLALEGCDIIAVAQTGTGKTAAFLLPIIQALEKNPQSTALVMGPTREIVYQIADAARIFLKNHPEMRVVSIIGGARMSMQLDQLRRNPRIVIGTPGRLNDLIERRKLSLAYCRTLVFDEADRMLDMGFAPQINEVVRHIPALRQTMMFSATIAPQVEKLARTYLKNPKLISVGKIETAPELLKQKVIVTSLDQKEKQLIDELVLRKGSVLLFAQTQRRVEKLGYKLRDFGFNVETIHGGRTQGQRFKALKSFRDGKVNILIATDVASRGLDIGSICHVINFDLPTNPEDFLHRIGRTARNGKEGEALTLVIQSELGDFNRIKKYLKNCETVGQFAKSAQRAEGTRHNQRRSGGGGGGGGFGKRTGPGGGGGFGKHKGGSSWGNKRKSGFGGKSGGGSGGNSGQRRPTR